MPLFTMFWDLGTAAGYKMLVGANSGTYELSLDVGKAASGSITVPTINTYYGVVEPYDSNGSAGARSQEVAAQGVFGRFKLRR